MLLTDLPGELFSDIIGYLSSYLDVYNLHSTGSTQLKWANCIRLCINDDIGFAFRWPSQLLQSLRRLESFEVSSPTDINRLPNNQFASVGLPSTLRKLSIDLPSAYGFQFPLSRLNDLPLLEILRLRCLALDVDLAQLSIPAKLRVFECEWFQDANRISCTELLARLPNSLEVLNVTPLDLPENLQDAIDWQWPANLSALTLTAPCSRLEIFSQLPPSLTELRLTITSEKEPAALPTFWDTLPKGLQILAVTNYTLNRFAQPTTSQLEKFADLRIFDVVFSRSRPAQQQELSSFSWDLLPLGLQYFRLEYTICRISVVPSNPAAMPKSLTAVPAYFLKPPTTLNNGTSLARTILDLPPTLKIVPYIDAAKINVIDMLDELKHPRALEHPTVSTSASDSEENKAKKTLPQLLPRFAEEVHIGATEDFALFFDLPTARLRRLKLKCIFLPPTISQLPDCLVKLSCNQYSLPQGVASLPPTLRHLSVVWDRDDHVTDLVARYTHPVGDETATKVAVARRNFFGSAPSSELPPSLTVLRLRHFDICDISAKWISEIPGTLPLTRLSIIPKVKGEGDAESVSALPFPAQFSSSKTLRKLDLTLCKTTFAEVMPLIPQRLSELTLKLTHSGSTSYLGAASLRYLPTTLRRVNIHPKPQVSLEDWERANLPPTSLEPMKQQVSD